MTRLARIVIPGLPHHVTQRGNRRERVFFSDEDYQFYLDELRAAAQKAESEIWAWCLMPNHVHLLIVPRDVDGLRLTVANAHRRYAGRLNARNKWTGHVWQGRYSSVVMDEAHLWSALAYVSLNPVRARLVERAQDWPWSSARAHLTGKPDGITTLAPSLERVEDFAAFLGAAHDPATFEPLRRAEITGRPVGGSGFMEALEARLGRALKPKQRGRKRENVEIR
jgi:putative transposase